MSTGDWFSLRPLNFNYDELNQRLTIVESTLTSLQNLTNNLNTTVTQIETRVYNVEQFADTINLNLLNLTQQVNGMNQTLTNFTTQIQNLNNSIINLNNRVNNIENLQSLILEFTLTNYPFRQGPSTYYGSFTVSWYRPIIFNNGGGRDLKFLIMVVRAFYIDFAGSNLVFAYSDPINYPVPFVNNNDFKVQHAFNNPMITDQGHYEFIFYSPTQFQILAKCRSLSHPGSIINDSFFFLINYI
jgi:prefoldin subunit 5